MASRKHKLHVVFFSFFFFYVLRMCACELWICVKPESLIEKKMRTFIFLFVIIKNENQKNHNTIE